MDTAPYKLDLSLRQNCSVCRELKAQPLVSLSGATPNHYGRVCETCAYIATKIFDRLTEEQDRLEAEYGPIP